MAENLTVAYAVLGSYLLLVGGCGVLGAFLNFRNTRKPQEERPGGLVQEHFMAGLGLGMVTWFFSMAATLFSGYSVSGIVNEAYNSGWTATRWIPAGVGVYVGFIVLAPRCYALGKQRGYMTISELIFDRYLPTSSNRPWVAHALRLLSFAFLQLPVFTYLITQFRSVGAETEVFTDGGIDSLTAVLVSAGLLLICDIMGGMRAVAYSDVLQGAVLFIGSIIFLIIQQTELGGMRQAFDYWADPANLGKPRVNNMQLLPTQTTVVSYFDFVFRTTVAATMFPHLCQRLFAARSSQIMRRGLAAMNFTFFVVQLSSMITGWVAINALIGQITPGKSAFGTTLLVVARAGTGQAFASAMLLASAICAMMSTADSALLAFSTMWVRDLLKPYLWRNAPEWAQLVFGKIMAVVALAVGVLLAMLTIKTGTPDLSGLFSLQTVTPIHVAPAVWLGLHWRGLRGEAVLAGMVSGSAVTLGLVFSDKNVKYAAGDDMLSNGLSSSWIGFCVNIFVTVTLGLALQYLPILNAKRRAGAVESAAAATGGPAIDTSSSDASAGEADPRHLDIGSKRDTMLHPAMVAIIFLLLLFSVPFYWGTYNSPGYQAPLNYIGTLSAWAFTSLLISGFLAIAAATAYVFLWSDYEPLPWSMLPSFSRRSSEMTPTKSAASEALDADTATKTAVM